MKLNEAKEWAIVLVQVCWWLIATIFIVLPGVLLVALLRSVGRDYEANCVEDFIGHDLPWFP